MCNVATAEGRIQQLLGDGNARRADLFKKLEILRDRLQPVYFEQTKPQVSDNRTSPVPPESPVAQSLHSGNCHLDVMIELVSTMIDSVQL